jgi:hypothetical protein
MHGRTERKENVQWTFLVKGQAADGRKGGWAVAQSPILNTTITLSRLKRKGYESMLSYYLKTQPTIQ